MRDIEALAPLVGEWSTAIEMLFPPEMAGQRYAASDVYRWAPGGRFLLHDVDARMGDEHVQSFEVYAADDAGFSARNYGHDGTISDYRASLDDGHWRIEGESERFEGRFERDDLLAGLWWLKQGEAWVDWMRVELKRR